MSIFMPFGYGGELGVQTVEPFLGGTPVDPYLYVTARLLVNGAPVPIAAFNYNEPDGRLGATLSVTLANPSTAQLPIAGAYVFQIGYYRNGAWEWETLVGGGSFGGWESTVARANQSPADTLMFNAIDPLADRWERAPSVTTTYYDALKIELEPAVASPDSEVDAVTFQPILPTLTNHPNLKLYDALELAYVDGCGFASVKTNIPNYPISRVDFSDTAGYHAGIAPLVGMFRPLYFCDTEDNLWIVWAGASLPAGYTTRTVGVNGYPAMTESRMYDGTKTNQLTVSHTTPAYEPDDIIITGYYTETIANGEPGDATFTSTQTRTAYARRTRAVTGELVEERITGVVSETRNANDVVIEIDNLEEQYDSLGRKSGHYRVVQKLLPNTAGVLTLQESETEICEIRYGLNPINPDETVQLRMTTRVTGAALQQNDQTYLGEALQTELPKAHVNGYLDPDEDNAIVQVPLRATLEEFKIRSPGQVGVHQTITNLLAGVVVSSKWIERQGYVRVSNRKTLQRKIRLRLPGVNRPVQAFDAGEVPAALAKQLGQQELALRNDPQFKYALSLVNFDTSIRKGTIIALDDRDGLRNEFIVHARTISCTNLSRGGRITMAVTGAKLPPALT
ncbi:MAG: hypothetical protein MSG64_06330 [Pyrinomonadaceae bacterium MAG19_C2-C3]|nr:hypothetical protein [Pyrinomonadaceae bacterium MAG19_C2-C3]